MICVVKDTKGKIFGGYTDINFDKSNKYKLGQKNSFIYIFKDDKTISKSYCTDYNSEIYCHNTKSFTLGNKHNFVINDKCNNDD